MGSPARRLLLLLFAVSVPAHGYRTSAWIPAWDSKALTSMQTNAGKLDEGNPGWYTIAADGSVTKNPNAEAADLRAALSGIDLVPTIKNYINGRFDGVLVANVVGSPALRETLAENLTQLVVQNAYAGIDVDYESMTSDARDNFSAFVQLLAAKLHSAGKTLSVTVHAKTSDADTWRGPGAQDWRAIGASADTVKIMAYDNHWNGSVAGPIAPLGWLDSIATYAETTMPLQKVIIGLPWYGYNWQGTSATGVVYTEAMALAQSVGAQITRDANGEATFTYADHIVYFQDDASYRAKIDSILKKHARIGGFAHWRAGGEDPAIWSNVARLQSSVAPPLPTTGCAINGPSAVTVAAGQISRVTFSVTEAATLSVEQIDPFPGTITAPQSAAAGTPAVVTIMPAVKAPARSYRVALVIRSGASIARANVTIVVQANAARRRSAGH